MKRAKLGGVHAGAAFLLALAFVPRAQAEEPRAIAALERDAMASFVAGQYGPADENIRAAIALADNDSFNRLALLQGLIAARMGSDGRSLMGAAIAAHESNAWPRPVIAYLLGERKLQQVADEIRRSGNPFDIKRQQICELSFYAGAFAVSDGEARFGRQLLEKAGGACDRNSPLLPMAAAELAALSAQP
ncbi:hypothetical protein [Dongia sp.]|uniref:hypothetical protein n=1 Tax=Dongia sp. TaxID=1977262 RepID=UPI0035AF45A5